ncbi:MAG: hypothetical protein M3422_12520 [Actinomycetota bacterium]|nr:hypothetical protein [Actinomycetota bacterium]
MFLVRLLLAVVATAGVAACETQREEADGPRSQEDQVTTADSPVEEGTGLEPPLPPADEVAVNLPELPVGGSSTGEPEAQCAAATLSPVPDGVSVTVTAIRFSEDGVFTARGSGCDSHPPCAGFTFTPERSTCGVAVNATGTTDEENVLLFLDGKCVEENTGGCAELRGHGSVPLIPPMGPPAQETEGTTTTDETTDETTPLPTE